jgi:hypothetical protein
MSGPAERRFQFVPHQARVRPKRPGRPEQPGRIRPAHMDTAHLTTHTSPKPTSTRPPRTTDSEATKCPLSIARIHCCHLPKVPGCGRRNRRKHGGRLRRPRHTQNRARRPVLWVPLNAPESAISRFRPTTEQRARTTVLAILAVAQNGTSVAFVRSTRGIEPDVRKSDSTIQSRHSGRRDLPLTHTSAALCLSAGFGPRRIAVHRVSSMRDRRRKILHPRHR